MSKKASLKDIANEAGVSIALVSYVLNGKNTKKINIETASRIKKIASDLKYRPNQIAKSLKNSKTYTIGLIVADISNFFYSYIAGFIESEANSLGYNVLFGSAYEDPDKFNVLLNIMIDRQVDGLILAIPEGAENCINTIKNIDIPYVLIDREFPQFEGVKTVCLNNYHASSLVVDKFKELGCKKIAAVALDSNLFHLNERSRGFLETSEKLFGKENTVIHSLSEDVLKESIGHIVESILADPYIDGICCFTNKIAMEVLPLLLNNTTKIKDLKLICFDDTEAYKLFPYPISIIKQPLEEMSKMAVQQLFVDDDSAINVHYFGAEMIDINSR